MKGKILQSPKGMRDILPEEQPYWEKIRKTAKEIADSYNYLKIDTPVLEHAELFERPLGETSDVVQKEMFIVRTKGGDRLALRPEGTAGIARAYVQHGLSYLSQPLKLFYEGPMFRHESPQAGRFRQFHQLGFEIISGDDDPVYDAQAMLAIARLLEGLKIKNFKIQLNSIGCKNCLPVYKKKLQNFYKDKDNLICKDCQQRIKINPLRVLDCKNENCQIVRKNAPILLDNLCSHCRKHFKSVLEYAEEIQLPYELNHYLVRGFDYYTRTVFEFFADNYDLALASGGRYDYLIQLIGGKQSPAVGGAVGIERLIEFVKSRQLNILPKQKPKVFLVHIGDEAKKKSLKIIDDLLNSGVAVLESLGKESLKTQLRGADKFGSPLVLIFGQKEVYEESIIIRDMKTGTQETVALKKIAEVIKGKLK